MANVLIVGIATIDFVLSVDDIPQAPEKYRARGAQIVGGGCAGNAAVAIAKLGGSAKLAARLGDDQFADIIIAELHREGVNTDLVDRAVGGRSSFSSVCVDKRGERQIVNFRGEGLTSRVDMFDHPIDADAVLVDTRWPDGGLAALTRAQKQRIPGVLDAEAPVDPRLMQCASHVAFSRPGLLSLTNETDLAKALAEVAAPLAGWACVTDGANGVYYTDGTEIKHRPSFPVAAVDTLGAGDVWHGAFALRLGEGADEAAAIVFANAAAALKCMNPGGRAGIPGRLATEDFMKENRQWN